MVWRKQQVEGNLNSEGVELSTCVDLALNVDSKVWDLWMGVFSHVVPQPP